jgi:asparagine synthase (glutamine-hydrolysing)
MCGIWSYIALKKHQNAPQITQLFTNFMQTKYRGPDNSYFETYNNVTIGFHRLAIIDDTFTSNQPFIIEDDIRTCILICNGEIYNYRELIKEFALDPTIKNDCATILHLYYKFLTEDRINQFYSLFQEKIRGEFAFNIFVFNRSKQLTTIVAGRDQIGVRPLYTEKTATAITYASEIKSLSHATAPHEFPPGKLHIHNIDTAGTVSTTEYTFRTVYRVEEDPTKRQEQHLEAVRTAVINSIRRRLHADKPIAFLLSGGVDSSLVAAISAKILGKPIRTFCCGMTAGSDIQYARAVAEHIGSIHTEVMFTPEEGLRAIDDVIRTTETWDTTTIRASVGQYLVSKYIAENTDCKVVMVGEGPDEVCSSYLFNWYAPTPTALAVTAREYVANIHYYDVKRADRCITRWGLEGRVALLDPEFIAAYWSIPAEQRMPTYKNMEKWWLRAAFEYCGCSTDNIGDLSTVFNDDATLPAEVLWRKKEAFSDGVSSPTKSWFQIIHDWIEERVSDEEFAASTAPTKEAHYYRRRFIEFFGESRVNIIPGYWQPKWSADGQEVTQYIDPSARILPVYNQQKIETLDHS